MKLFNPYAFSSSGTPPPEKEHHDEHPDRHPRPAPVPRRVQLTATDRQAAHDKIESAARQGVLTAPAGGRPAQTADAAQTRGELRQVFNGLDDAVPPAGLTLALRIATVGWLAVCAIQFVIWLMLAGFGHLDWPVVALVRRRTGRGRRRSCGGPTSPTTASPSCVTAIR